MIQTRSEFRFENSLQVPGEGIFTPYWQRALGGLAILVNTLISSRNTGVTAAIATGTDVAHGMSRKPAFVMLAPQDGVPTNFYVDTITDTTFRIHFTGGGSHLFGWSGET